MPCHALARKRWIARGAKRLESRKSEDLAKVLGERRPQIRELAKFVRNEAESPQRNTQRTCIVTVRARRWPASSDLAGASYKEGIGFRPKRSSMVWALRGANAVIALHRLRRCGRFEDDSAHRPATA